MGRQSAWATKVAGLIQSGNAAAALAQIKVAPAVQDLQQLRVLLTNNGQLQRHPQINQATQDGIVALSSPRLHRSP